MVYNFITRCTYDRRCTLHNSFKKVVDSTHLYLIERQFEDYLWSKRQNFKRIMEMNFETKFLFKLLITTIFQFNFFSFTSLIATTTDFLVSFSIKKIKRLKN